MIAMKITCGNSATKINLGTACRSIYMYTNIYNTIKIYSNRSRQLTNRRILILFNIAHFFYISLHNTIQIYSNRSRQLTNRRILMLFNIANSFYISLQYPCEGWEIFLGYFGLFDETPRGMIYVTERKTRYTKTVN